jgi:class 3 adenylate cyclase
VGEGDLTQYVESNSRDEIGELGTAFNKMVKDLSMAQSEINKRTNELKVEKQKSDELLLNILPIETAEELKRTGKANAKHYDSVSVIFTDFVDFTAISEKMSADKLVRELHYCFSNFDLIISNYKIEKIKTIGDSYMCVAGLPQASEMHPYHAVLAALEIRDFMINYKLEKETLGEIGFDVRIGIHTGPVVAGIVGVNKFAYDIWGSTVNVASRFETASESNKINISETLHNIVKDQFDCTKRGKIAVKGIGSVSMYFVNHAIGNADNITGT